MGILAFAALDAKICVSCAVPIEPVPSGFAASAGRRPVDADPAASSGSQASPDPEDLIEDEYEVDIMGLDGDAGAQQAQHASDDEEAAILLIMEFTGLGRPAAMDLLADSGGDAQTVLANLYQ